MNSILPLIHCVSAIRVPTSMVCRYRHWSLCINERTVLLYCVASSVPREFWRTLLWRECLRLASNHNLLSLWLLLGLYVVVKKSEESRLIMNPINRYIYTSIMDLSRVGSGWSKWYRWHWLIHVANYHLRQYFELVVLLVWNNIPYCVPLWAPLASAGVLKLISNE